MRPLKLVMTGFESYKDRTEINFEELGTKGLYLITGDTGAGKTTIFDAITFVLYGSPSGNDRSVEMLRSHFADENTPTLVELDFEAKGKKYHIKRNPDYERKALRGEGTTKESANALLEYLSENKDPISGLSKVNAEIENILNLKKEQFCQIAMIAQGSFQKLLLAKKEEKQQLFRELFHTEKYQRLQDALKSDRNQADKLIGDLKIRLHEALNRIEVNENDEKSDEINRIKLSPKIMKEDIETLRSFVEKDEKLLSDVMTKLSDTEVMLDKLKGELKIGQDRQQFQENINNTEKAKSEKEGNLSSIKEALSLAEEEAKKLPALEKDKTLLEASLKDYEKIAAEEAALEKLFLQLGEEEKTLLSLNDKKTELTDNIKKLKEEASLLKNAGEKLGSLQAEEEKIISEGKALNEIKEQLFTFEQDKKNLAICQENVKTANDQALEANNSYSEKLRLFNLEQAGILAEGLMDGQACPVCGSTEHPHPAVKSAKAPSQAELEAAKKTAETLQKAASELSLQAAQEKTAVEKAEESINKELKKYFEKLTADDKDIENIIEERKADLRKKVSEIELELKKEKEDKARREEVDKIIPEDESKLKEIEGQENQLQIKLSSEKATLEADKKTLAEKKSDLKYKTLQEAQENFAQLEGQIKRLKDKLELAKQNKEACEKEIENIAGRIETLKKQLKETKAVDLEKVEADMNKFSSQKDSLNNQRDALNERRGINLESVKKVEELVPELEAANERYNMINALCEVAAGSSRGKSGKPSLEVYVQMHCLDQINHRANLRLKTMTENKYELRRRIEEDGSELGLDLNVKDFYTGRERNVQTLSGGEQFQASLSLALGLADEVQDSAGGIKLDTMFIDEGFGTLDPDTLNKAMRALENLSQGDKLIGIISHVEELEARIPKKIMVKKDEVGISHATLVND